MTFKHSKYPKKRVSNDKKRISDDNKNHKKTEIPKKTTPSKDDVLRLNKYISNSGMCSRRDADLYIKSGNVMVNGKIITEMGYKVKVTDEVIFDGSRITPEKKQYVLLNKPKGFSTSDKGLKNAYELVRASCPSYLKPVGRMDSSSLGLLLLTNDEDLIQKFTNSSQHSSKLYQISLSDKLKKEDFDQIKKGVYVDNKKVWVDEISYIENQPKSEVGIELKTSNIKVVKSLFEKLGYKVLKLDRMMFAGLSKWGLSRGQWRFLNPQEIINLKNIK